MESVLEFQFLRPYWLLAMLPVFWIVWRIWRQKLTQGGWNKIIATPFQPLLLNQTGLQQQHRRTNAWLIGLLLLWSSAIIALAGPSFQTINVPAQKQQQGTVIVLDLSLSMLADDISPSRLERVKFMLTDLLKQHPELRTGLIGYAATAHIITPISDDNTTLLGLLPALNPVIMPSYGSNPMKGLTLAQQLLEGAHITQGHIIWITDDIETNQIADMNDWFHQSLFSTHIMVVGSHAGGAVHIPNYGLLKDESGKVVLPTVPVERFQPFSQQPKVSISQFDVAADNVNHLLSQQHALNSTKPEDETRQHQYPLDSGMYLLFLLVPFAALLFRRGWLYQWLPMTLIPLVSTAFLVTTFLPNDVLANEEANPKTEQPFAPGEAFKSNDQRGYEAWQAGHYETAKALFEDTQWQAATYYRLGDYEKAANLFTLDKSAKGFYNLGNAYAKNGQLQEAKTAYKQAIELQPILQNAKDNLALIEALLTQQQTQQQSNQSNEGDNKALSEQQSSDSEKPSQRQNQSDPTDETNSYSSQTNRNQANTENDLNSPVQPDDQAKQTSPTETNQSEQQSANDAKREQVTQDSNNPSAEDSETNDQAGRLDEQTITESEKSDGIKETETRQANSQSQEKQLATQNWLNQIPDQPGLFLKRKFEHQYQTQPLNQYRDNAPQGSSKQW